MNLFEALNPDLPARIAIVGAGGKTTALFQLARQVAGNVWVTTTTHLGINQICLADQHLVVPIPNEIDILQLKKKKVSLISGGYTNDERIHGVDPVTLELLFHIADRERISIILEADGSKSFPLKAPAEYEPVIPSWVTHVIVVVGLSALGRPFTSQWVHRPERFARLTGLREGELISIESISDMLIHAEGGLKNIPPESQRIVLLNQADAEAIQAEAKGIVSKLIKGGFNKVIIGSLQREPENLQVYDR